MYSNVDGQNGDRWEAVAHAARETGYNPEYIRHMLRRGVVRGRKFGMGWAVNMTELQEYMEDTRHGPRPRRAAHLN